MFVNSDFSDLLRIFNDNNVRYLVIGGYAVVQYAEAVHKALREFSAPLAGLTRKTFQKKVSSSKWACHPSVWMF